MRGALFLFSAFLILAAQPAQATNWQIDSARSHISFTAKQAGTLFSGTLPAFSGTIQFDPSAPSAPSHVRVTLPLAGVSTKDSDRDTELVGKNWLDLADFPTAAFSSDSIIAEPQAGSYEIAGALTLRDVTAPIRFPFILTIDGDTAHATATITLDRAALKLGRGAWADDFTTIGHDITVSLDLWAIRLQP